MDEGITMYWIPAILIAPYFFLLLKIYRGLLKIETFTASTDPATFVSVVVACHNEQKNLPTLLNSISCQNYPIDLFEVIIVDDNSTDRTLEIAMEFSRLRNFVTMNNLGRGKKQAIRTGISASKGTLIITTDADCKMTSNWIRTIAAFYEFNKPEMIICPVKLESTPGFFSRFQELEFISLQGITAGSALMKEATMCNGANLAFTREAYLGHSQNLHDQINSGDDIFLLHSLKEDKSSRIIWMESPEAIVTTKSSPTFISFIKQRSRWISKARAYKDRDSIGLGIATFVAVLIQLLILIGLFIYHDLIRAFILIMILKSIPDFLILMNASTRHGKKKLMWWFLPAQLIYPFYVLFVILYSLTSRNK
jgi:cellulose synthase/poly-beta-1,6-N-acetylglucosamine synthase-like glycosyltransferase